MAHGFLSVSGGGGRSFGLPFDWLRKKVSDALKNLQDKNKQVSGELDKVSKDLRTDVEEVKVGIEKDLVAKRMLSPGKYGGIQRYSGGGLDSTKKTPQLPPASPRLKGGTFTDISKPPGGLNPDTFFKQAQTGVGPSGEYLTNAQRREAFVKSRQEAIQTAAAVNKSPSITPDSGVEVVAAVNRNTEAIIRLVDITKQQTANDTKLSEKAALTQEKLMGRQRAALEERSLERGGDLSGFMTPEMKKIQKQATSGAGPGGQGYSGQLGGGGPNVMDMLDIGSDIMDMRKGKVRRITQGRDGRTSRQRLRDMKARKAGLRPSSRGVRPSGGGLARTGGSALGRGAGFGKALAGGAKGGGLLKGAAMAGKATRGIPGLGLLTAGLEFGDRMSSGQNALQAGVGTAGSVGGGLAGAAAGAAIGSVIPGIGTAIGAVIGGLLGSMGGGAAADMATGANNVRPMAVGGIISSPLTALMGEAGKEAVFPLEGKEGEKVFKMFGMGILEAQLGAPAMVAKIGALGLKKYFEKDGGFERMGEGLKDFFAGLGGALASLFGGNANAGTLNQAPGYLGGGMSADEQQLTEALIAGEEGLRTEAYKDSEGIWTIGYGQTTLNGRAVRQGDRITKEQALEGFRSNIRSHAQRAIDQVGEERWKQLDPKARAVLTSLAYNYGSIPSAVLPAAKTGSTEDIAKSMNALYGHNRGVLKGRRQREQSILRGNLQGDAANPVRLDKDFMAGGKFAGAGTGPMITGAGPQAGTGMATFGETGRVFNQAGYVHGHFQSDTGTKADVVNDVLPIVRGLLNSGVTDVSITSGETFRANMSDAEIRGLIEKGIAKHTHSGTGKSVDIFVPKGTKVPFPLADVKNTGGRGGVTGILPGSGKTWVGHLTPDSKSGGRAHSPQEPNMAGTNIPGPQAAAPGGQYNIPGAPQLSSALNAANPNTGTPMMATSAQVAMAGITQSGAAPTIINNNYYTTGGGGAVNGNGLPTGIDMTSTGADVFSILKPRTIG